MRCQFKEVTSMRLKNATKILKNVHTLGPYGFGFNINVLQCISFIDVLSTAPVMGRPGVRKLLCNKTATLSTMIKQRLGITE
jgi:hypothetical protein